MRKHWLIAAVLALLALLPAVVLADGLMEGDFNGDGHVNIIDAMNVAQYTVDRDATAGIMPFVPTAENLLCGDVNDDGATNIIDAMIIAQYTVDREGTAGVLCMPLWQSPADDGMLPPQP